MMPLDIPGRIVRAYSISGEGHIVGTSGADSFVYRDGTVEVLPEFEALAINNDDQIAGLLGHIAGLWDDDGPHTLDDEGGYSGALAIRDDGIVAGYSTRGGLEPRHAVLWTSYGVSDLGTLPDGDWAFAAAISGDLVVGVSSTAPFGTAWHAFVYDTNGPGYAVDLNDLVPRESGWTLQGATGVNIAGQIVGYGQANGAPHAFLLTPVASTSPR